MSPGGIEDRRRRWGALFDLAPSALIVATAIALDLAALSERVSLAAAGALGDSALAVSAVGALAVLGAPGALRRGLARRAGIRAVDVMSGEEFEARLVTLYRSMGYRVEHTGRRGDFGADLVIEPRAGGHDLDPGHARERVVVQAKRYHGVVGIQAVQEAIGALSYYGATGAVVVTNSTCTPAARSLASASSVELVERDALVRMLAAHRDVRPRPWTACALQLVDGVRLCAYALGTVVRLGWWLLRALWRLARAAGRLAR